MTLVASLLALLLSESSVGGQATGLMAYDTSLSDEAAASILMKQVRLDFDDALQYYAAKKLGAEAIVSFDKDFDGLSIPRSEPKGGT